MGKTQRTSWAVAALFIAASACSAADEPESELEFLSFHKSSADGGHHPVLDSCTIGGEHAQIAVVRVTTGLDQVTKRCSPPRPPFAAWDAERLDSLVGSAPPEFRMATGLHDVVFSAEVDGTYLLALREWDGMYVPIHAIEVQLHETAEAASAATTSSAVLLQHRISDLKREIQDDTACDDAERSSLLTIDDASYDRNLSKNVCAN